MGETGGVLKCNAFKVSPIKFSSQFQPVTYRKHITCTSQRNVLAFAYIPITPHLPPPVHDSAHVCKCVGWLYTLFWICVYVCVLKMRTSEQSELGSPVFPRPFYICSYIPPLIENRALLQSTRNKELLFPCSVHCHVRVATATSNAWVFPLILSSRLIPYRKLITDWWSSGFPLMSHGSARGSVSEGMIGTTQEQQACCAWNPRTLWATTTRSCCVNFCKQRMRLCFD